MTENSKACRDLVEGSRVKFWALASVDLAGYIFSRIGNRGLLYQDTLFRGNL